MSLTVADGSVSHECLTPGFLEAREYQLELATEALAESTLISLPTGLGKTAIAAMVAAERLAAFPDQMILMVAPTKPLVEQHTTFFREAMAISDDRIQPFTGSVKPEKRGEIWADPDTTIVLATPACIKNDLVANRVDLSECSHLVIDECHRATGDYPYVFVAERYHALASNPLVTAMSASPGESEEEILQVCRNLGIRNITVRTEDDPSVADYQYETPVRRHEVSLPPEVQEIRSLMTEAYEQQLEKLKELEYVSTTNARSITMSTINKLRGQTRQDIKNGEDRGYKGASYVASAGKIGKAIRTLESQGLDEFVASVERIEDKAGGSDGSRADARVMQNANVQEALRRARSTETTNQKLADLRTYVIPAAANDQRVIVFSESRPMVERIVDYLNDHNIASRRFVGQASKGSVSGMTQKQQVERLDEFRAGEFDVLVSTSVAEEGLDIPAVDLVIMFEPVAQAIQAIQRRGRTGRQRAGEVIVMMTKDSSDEGIYWAAQHKQSQMSEALDTLKDAEGRLEEKLAPEGDGADVDTYDSTASTLDDYGRSEADDESPADEDGESSTEDSPTVETVEGLPQIIVDQRELQSSVAPALSAREDVSIRLETLDIGDYIVSNRCGVERKSMSDFLDTLTGSRSLWDQFGELARAYDRPVLLLEGDLRELYTRNIHPNAVRGALIALTLGLGATVIPSRDEEDTAALLAQMAVREQSNDESGPVSDHASKTGKTQAERQEYIVSSIGDVGPATARTLLEHCGSPRAVFTASEEQLQGAEGVGPKTAKSIRADLDAAYEG
jgi:Fanconi anemia group M protein